VATRPRGKLLPHHPETSGSTKRRYWKVLIVAAQEFAFWTLRGLGKGLFVRVVY
jgi:hypothetical protein